MKPKLPQTYRTGKSVGMPEGFTSDGYYLGPSDGQDVFRHPGPLPQLNSRTVRSLSPLGDQARPVRSHRVASLDEIHAEEMRKYYGDADGLNDGARITWATPIESEEVTKRAAEIKLTPEQIARMWGEDSLRRLRGN